MPGQRPILDPHPLEALLREVQARLGDLPAGVTLTLHIGAPSIPITAAEPASPAESEMPTWYSPKELADLHGVRPATVQKWVREHRFPGVRRLPNGAIRIPKELADAVLTVSDAPTSPRVRLDVMPTEPMPGILSPAQKGAENQTTQRVVDAKSSNAEPRFDVWRRTRPTS